MKRFKNMRVVVTGGAGFIGSHLVEKLLVLGAQVTVIDNLLHGNKLEHLGEQPNLSLNEGDVRDTGVVSGAFKDKDLVFHLAAVVGVEETQMTPLEVLDVEIQGTLNVLNLAVSNGIKRVVFASSSEVYGDSAEPMKEEGPFSPKSTYAVTKLVGEEYCRAFYQKYGLDYTCLRYFNVYGPRQDARFVISRFMTSILSHEPIQIYGDGKQTRDFTYIDDAVNMSLLAGIKTETRGEMVNIGTGRAVSINELAELVAKSMKSTTSPKPSYTDYDDKRPLGIEVFCRMADTAKARRLLQYEPETSLASGIKKYINWQAEKERSRC